MIITSLKHKWSVLSIKDKQSIIVRLEKGEKGTNLSAEYGVRKQISDIRKNKEKIMKFADFLETSEGTKPLKKTTVTKPWRFIWRSLTLNAMHFFNIQRSPGNTMTKFGTMQDQSVSTNSTAWWRTSAGLPNCRKPTQTTASGPPQSPCGQMPASMHNKQDTNGLSFVYVWRGCWFAVAQFQDFLLPLHSLTEQGPC